MHIYFIRVKDRFISTFEDKFKDLVGVVRVEQVLVEGRPAKAERTFSVPGVSHTMLIVRIQYESTTAEVEKILEAGNLLGALYQWEKCKLAD